MFWTRVFGGSCAVALAAVLWSLPAQAQSANPLVKLNGNWSGNGTITLNDGSRERIRCRASYASEAGGTRIGLRCASDSYKFELSSNVQYDNGRVSGNWSEATRNAAGEISGTASANHIDVRAGGQTFAALISIAIRSDSQSVSIRSPGSTMQEVAISLSRQ